MCSIRKASLLSMTILVTPLPVTAMAPPYPEEIILKAGLMPSFAFAGFQADLVDRVVELAQHDNVKLSFEMTPIEEFYTTNLALIDPDCHPGETTEINGTTYNCDDFDLIVGDFWTTPKRYTIVDFSPALLTSSITAMKYTEKTKYPSMDVTTFSQAKRAGVPVCVVESSTVPLLLNDRYPDLNLVDCPQEKCLDMLRDEVCFLFATDEMELRSIQTKHPYFEVTGERLSRQLIAWPISKSLDPTAAFLVNKWIYAAISSGVIDELYFEYFEKKLCPIGTAGRDCELPCDPDHGASNAQGECICESIRWTGDDCSIEVPTELNMIPPTLKGIVYFMFAVNTSLVLGAGVWLKKYWDRPEVQYSQPFFLALVLVGCLVSTATILAMTKEDEGDGPVDACTAIPWLYSLGFSITFGTLFAKIRRVYSIFSQGHQRASMMNANNSTRRASLSFQDTLATIGKVLLLDVVILTLWTVADPVHWRRTVIREDQFGFPLESEGYCTSDKWQLFLGVIIALHIALCAVACYMCYVARNIPNRYSEHKYLTIAMISNLQVYAIGVPVLIIAEDDPAAHIFVRSAVVWMNDFVVLALVFGNLMYAVHNAKSSGTRTEKQKQQVSEAVRSLSKRQRHSAVSNSVRTTKNGQPIPLHNDGKSVQISEVDIESDLESNGGSTIRPPGEGTTAGTSETVSEKKPFASEITLSGFDGSDHDESGLLKSPGARWVPSPDRPEQCEQTISADDPNIQVEEGIIIVKTGETSVQEQIQSPTKPVSSMPFTIDLANDEAQVEDQSENANQRQIQDAALELPSRLTSIAEWSDDEEVSANAEPPALRKSVVSEHPPIMPRRFESEFDC